MKIADEILYQSKIHPSQRIKCLDDEDFKRIYKKLKEIINLSISVNSNYNLFPKNWIFHYRNHNDGFKIPDVGEIEFLKGSGKSTLFVPSVQKLKKKIGKRNHSLENDEDVLSPKEVKLQNETKSKKKKLKKDEKDDKNESIKKKKG
eukprot:jgi/Orpsp1_1/1180247/evm.model.c7180000072652.2